jgi:hypothetical protein
MAKNCKFASVVNARSELSVTPDQLRSSCVSVPAQFVKALEIDDALSFLQ